MKKITCIIAIMIFAVSCKNKTKQDTSQKLQEYVLTLYKDKYDPKKSTFSEDNNITTVQSKNDTTAYLMALNTFYNERVKQRALYNYGQPKNFLIVDKNNIDLSLKLTARMVDGLQLQVKSMPEIKKMLDGYNRDSLMN